MKEPAFLEVWSHAATIALLALVVACSFIHAKHELRRVWRRLRERIRALGPGSWRIKVRAYALTMISMLVISSHVAWYIYEMLRRAFFEGGGLLA